MMKEEKEKEKEKMMMNAKKGKKGVQSSPSFQKGKETNSRSALGAVIESLSNKSSQAETGQTRLWNASSWAT